MGKLILEQMEFYASHGYYPEERKIGGKYLVDLELETDMEKSIQTDELKDTVNYYEIYTAVEDEMKKSSKLIEHLAGRIKDRIFGEFNSITGMRLKLTKVNPPIHAKIKSVSIILHEERKRYGSEK